MQRNIFIILLLISFIACEPVSQESIPTSSYKDEEPVEITEAPIPVELINPEGMTLAQRINPPGGFERISVEENSFAEYLRNTPLKPQGAIVKYHDGTLKSVEEVYMAVVDLPIGTKNLHQCADAVMRLRAEYLWKQKAYDQIHFNFTNGFRVDYTEWMKGRRMIVKGNKTYWNNRNQPSNTYEDFWEYMELIFTFAGTASLEKELKAVELTKMQIGDVFIQGGFPGHAVIVMDMAYEKNTGKQLYLLAQSYMPAQELQILTNPSDDGVLDPWYELKEISTDSK